MTRRQHHDDQPDERRTRITLAVLTGVLAGATRALAEWLLEHLTMVS